MLKKLNDYKKCKKSVHTIFLFKININNNIKNLNFTKFKSQTTSTELNIDSSFKIFLQNFKINKTY